MRQVKYVYGRETSPNEKVVEMAVVELLLKDIAELEEKVRQLCECVDLGEKREVELRVRLANAEAGRKLEGAELMKAVCGQAKEGP